MKRKIFVVLALLTLACFLGYIEAKATKQNDSPLVNDLGTVGTPDFGCASGVLSAPEAGAGPAGKGEKDFSLLGTTAHAARVVTVNTAKAGYRITKPARRTLKFAGRQVGKFLF